MEMLRKLFRRTKHSELPDLSRQGMNPDIPLKQRALVDQQLREMHEGHAAPHFAIMRDVFSQIELPEFTLLDAGCGSGYYSEVLQYMAKQNIQYTGSDYNADMLKLAKKYYPKLTFAQMDIRALAWIDCAFDVVISSAVIAHVREWEKAISEITRVSRQYAVLHRTWVNLGSETRIEIKREYDLDVYRVYIKRQELLDSLSRAGFVLVLEQECHEGTNAGDTQNFTYLLQRRAR